MITQPNPQNPTLAHVRNARLAAAGIDHGFWSSACNRVSGTCFESLAAQRALSQEAQD